LKKSRTDSEGFTLIEVMVALAIVAVGMTALLTAASSGIGGASLSARYIEATRRAESRLAALGRDEPLAPGEQGGDDGAGYRWRIRVAAPALHPSLSPGGPTAALYDVDVTMSWAEGGRTRAISLQTQRAAQIVSAASKS
jgi:general secretion pathway protein I